jgi:hypothetical protein
MDNEERRVCPPEFTQRLIQVGGYNRYGTANWRIVWGQTEREWVGGQWETPTGKFRIQLNARFQMVKVPITNKVNEMRWILKYDGQPCWFLERWFGPESYGTPERWYRENKCARSGLPMLGPYPEQGYYEACYPLRNGIAAYEVNDYVIDAFVPLILRTHYQDEWMRKAARYKLRMDREKKDHDRRVQLYVDKAPVGGPISYAGQLNRTSRVARVNLGSEILKGLPKTFGQYRPKR